MKPLYLIIGQGCIDIDLKPTENKDIDKSDLRYYEVLYGLERVKKEEEHITIKSKLEFDVAVERIAALDADIEIRLCGAYKEAYIQDYMKEMVEKGINASIYDSASVSLEDALALDDRINQSKDKAA